MNFRNEWEHDELLMKLIRKLDRIDRLDVLENGLGLPHLGKLKDLRRRRAFDVEATFSQRRLIVETKVDSDEGGRWEAIDDPSAWQTERIATMANEADACVFITYGFSEFFTKPFEFGPASSRFCHITLDIMVRLLGAVTTLVSDPDLDD